MTDQVRIIAKVVQTPEQGLDVWQGDTSWTGESFADAFVYPPSSLTKKPGDNFRPLPEHYADQARTYIAVICQRYPLQLRVLMGLAMWLRFCEVWNDTGKRHTAMRVI